MINIKDHKWCKLSTQQASDFERDGFLIVRNALDQDLVQRITEVGDRLVNSDLELGRRDAGPSDGFRNVIVHDPVFLDLLCHHKTFPLVVQLMGPHLQLHTSDLIWRKSEPSSDEPAPLGWHRDIARMTRDLDYARMPRVEIKVAYYLTDCPNPSYGQTNVAAGSHRWLEAWKRTENEAKPPGATAPILKAGDAIFFENRTYHAAGINTSGQTRKTLMMGYSHSWIRPDDYDQQSEELLNQCDTLQRSLLVHKNPSFDDRGRFRACVMESPLEQWAKQHGFEEPICH